MSFPVKGADGLVLGNGLFEDGDVTIGLAKRWSKLTDPKSWHSGALTADAETPGCRRGLPARMAERRLMLQHRDQYAKESVG
jgi:hypothetical protein